MSNRRKPLQPQEVGPEWYDCIQWKGKRKQNSQKNYCIGVGCPSCGNVRWVPETTIRTGVYKSPQCQRCASRRKLQPDEVPEVWRKQILWGKKGKINEYGYWSLWVRCAECGDCWLVSESRLRFGNLNDKGLCGNCYKALAGPDCEHAWRGGRNVNEVSGYVYLHINGLDGQEYDLAKEMMGSAVRILEHRLVMALALGRPLKDEEIVHHLDGHRSHNSLDNLELLTKETHPTAHGNPYYQKWQEVLSVLNDVKDNVVTAELCDDIDVALAEFGEPVYAS